VAQLQQLIQARAVQELRTAYNGRFGASLLFSAESMTYYVALFQQREFWRVFKTNDESLAERMYTQYRQDTVDYAAADLERIKLQAEVAKAEKQLNESADQLTVLQNDLALQRQQEALAIAQREESRREAQALAEQEREAREQLRELQSQIKDLERQRAGMLQRQRGR
jgi:chromosome segregation ATPase